MAKTLFGYIAKFFSTYTLLKITLFTLILTILSVKLTFIRPILFRVFVCFIFLSIVYIVITRIVINYIKVVWNGIWPLNTFYKFKILGDDVILNSADIQVNQKYNGIAFIDPVPKNPEKPRSWLTPYFDESNLKLNKKFTYGQTVSIVADGKKLLEGRLKGVRETKLIFDKSDIDVMKLTEQRNTNPEIGITLGNYTNIIIKSGKRYKKSKNWKD